MSTISKMDEEFYRLGREHILGQSYEWVLLRKSGECEKTLEIGPSVLVAGANWDTLDTKPGCTFQADITKRTPIEDSTYDCVLCQDVLEHTLNPFAALAEIRRILRPGGLLLASAPMNFREHGPLPDCWRFTRHGWRVLLRDWDAVELDVLMTPDRFLMPLHICAAARCNKTKATQDSELMFPLEST